MIIIAKAIFNSKIRYGIAAYLIPIFEREEVKMKKLSPHAKELQVVQNSMVRVSGPVVITPSLVRVILVLNWANHINIKRKEINKNAFCEPNGGLSYSYGGIQHNKQESFGSTSKEIEYA